MSTLQPQPISMTQSEPLTHTLANKQHISRVLSGLTHQGNNLTHNIDKHDQNNIFMMNAFYMQQMIQQRQLQSQQQQQQQLPMTQQHRHPVLPPHSQSPQQYFNARM